MLYYAKDHALKQPFEKVLASIERFLALASDDSRPPISASIHTTQETLTRTQPRAILSDSMHLKNGFDLAERVGAVVQRIHENSNNPSCSFGVRWVPNFEGPRETSFGILGIDRKERQNGGGFAHFIQLAGAAKSEHPNWAMLYLALPFEYQSEAFRSFKEKADSVLCFKLSPGAFRQLLRTKSGGFKAAKFAKDVQGGA